MCSLSSTAATIRQTIFECDIKSFKRIFNFYFLYMYKNLGRYVGRNVAKIAMYRDLNFVFIFYIKNIHFVKNMQKKSNSNIPQKSELKNSKKLRIFVNFRSLFISYNTFQYTFVLCAFRLPLSYFRCIFVCVCVRSLRLISSFCLRLEKREKFDIVFLVVF